MNLNTKIFLLINGFANKNIVLNDLMIFIARDLIVFVIIFALFYLIFRKRLTLHTLSFIVISTLLSLAVSFTIRRFYVHPRPFMDHLGVLLIPHAPENSFPSGHATFMFALTFSFFFLREIQGGIILLITAILVSISRIFIGVHFPMDIVGSILVSAIITSLVLEVLKRYFPQYGFARKSSKIVNEDTLG